MIVPHPIFTPRVHIPRYTHTHSVHPVYTPHLYTSNPAYSIVSCSRLFPFTTPPGVTLTPTRVLHTHTFMHTLTHSVHTWCTHPTSTSFSYLQYSKWRSSHTTTHPLGVTLTLTLYHTHSLLHTLGPPCVHLVYTLNLYTQLPTYSIVSCSHFFPFHHTPWGYTNPNSYTIPLLLCTLSYTVYTWCTRTTQYISYPTYSTVSGSRFMPLHTHLGLH